MYSIEIHCDPPRLCVCHHQYMYKTSCIIKLQLPQPLTTRVPLSPQMSSRLPHSRVIITRHVKVISPQHGASLFTFHPRFKAQLFMWTNSPWLAFRLPLSNNQIDLHKSDVLLPTWSKMSGVPTGGRVNNWNPGSTQMLRVCVCLCSGPLQ